MTYSLNIHNLVNSSLPPNHQTPILEAYLYDLSSGMVYLNNNLVEFISGVTYSYYNSSLTYSVGTRVIGGLSFNNQVYECISSSSSTTIGAILTHTISSPGHGFVANDILRIPGGSYISQIVVTSVTNPIGLKINITSVSAGSIVTTTLNSGGTGYSVGQTFTIDGGFALAVGTVTSVSSGVVTGYTIGAAGTGYSVTTGATTTIRPIYTGNVLTYTFSNAGYGYSVGTYSAIDGHGTGFVLGVLSVGGTTPPPFNSSVWQLVNDNFIGVNERSLYTNNKLTFEWALNRWFNTTFRQPIGVTGSATHSDIYISDIVYNYTAFHSAFGSTQSSYCFYNRSSEWVTYGGYTTPALSLGSAGLSYNINFPAFKYYTILNPQTTISSFINKYTVYSIPYNIVLY